MSSYHNFQPLSSLPEPVDADYRPAMDNHSFDNHQTPSTTSENVTSFLCDYALENQENEMESSDAINLNS